MENVLVQFSPNFLIVNIYWDNNSFEGGSPSRGSETNPIGTEGETRPTCGSEAGPHYPVD